MADLNAQQKQNGTRNYSIAQRNETALMLEDMYKGIAGDLKAVKKDILNEMKYASLQAGVLYQSIENGNKDTYSVLKNQLTEICDKIRSQADEAAAKLKAAVEESSKNGTEAADRAVMEIKFMYSQNQSIYESLTEALDELKKESGAADEALFEKYNAAFTEKLYEAIASVDNAVSALDEKVEALLAKETDYDKVAETIKERVLEALPYEEPDYDKIAESVAEKTEAQTAAHTKEILDTIAAVPAAENVDYNRIVDEVSDKVLEKVSEFFNAKDGTEKDEKSIVAEYDRIVYGTAEKVVESLPPVEKIDYARIAAANELSDEALEKVANAVAAKLAIPAPEPMDYDKLADAVLAKLPAPEPVDYDALADAVLAKLPAPEPVDYDKLADAVLAKLPVAEPMDYDKLADAVLAKLPAPEPMDYERLAYAAVSKIDIPEAEAIDYEKIADDVAAKIDIPAPEQIDYDRLAENVAERIPAPEPATYDVLVDDEGVKSIAATVAASVTAAVSAVTVEAKAAEIDTESLAAEISEKMGTPSYETILDEDGAQMIADAVAEKLNLQKEEETSSVEAEVAAAEDTVNFNVAGEEKVNEAEQLVARYDRSFTAKLKQSDDETKVRYSEIKNAFLSYKKVKSTVSWTGDRFNLGRKTIAKIGIRGKTLCVYFALDPKDPAFKQTVYNQKDMSDQKAHEKTPFMMKVKSNLGAKRAIRLADTVTAQMNAEKKKDFTAVDYKKMYRYAGDKQLEATGLIKKTMGKRTVFDFD